MDCKSNKNIDMIQSFIHTMNDKKLRTEIIKHSLHLSGKQESYQWLGTWIVQKTKKDLQNVQNIQQLSFSLSSVSHLVSKNKTKLEQKNSIFTVCILYDINLVHYVSFLYFPNHKKLISFDPGVELYLHGRETIVPLIRKAFYENELIKSLPIQQSENLGRCHEFSFCGKNWGIQYNGKNYHKLPADSFCQTWTIFFITRYLMQPKEDFSFIKYWCKINPHEREYFIISFFIIPYLTHFKNVQNQYLYHLQKTYSFSNVSLPEILHELFQYIEVCHLSNACSNLKIQCNKKA